MRPLENIRRVGGEWAYAGACARSLAGMMLMLGEKK